MGVLHVSIAYLQDAVECAETRVYPPAPPPANPTLLLVVS